MTRIKFVPWHPLLFAAFPIISLLAYNFAEIQATDILRSLFVSVLITSLLLFLLNSFFHNWHKAALIITLALILFFSYGHVYNYLKQLNLLAIGRHRLLAPVWLVIFGTTAWWAINTKRDLKIFTNVLNVIVLVALIIPTIQIYMSYREDSQKIPVDKSDPSIQLRVNEGETPPDIYYIVLDAYSRDDVLLELFDHDNTTFLNELTEIGFYVAHCSQSNYAQTRLSLATALNSNYIEELDPKYSGDSRSRAGMSSFIKSSVTRQLLEDLGYTTVAYETGFKWTEIGDADIYLSPNSIAGSFLDATGGLNKFEAMLISNSGGRFIFDVATLLPYYIQQKLNYPNQIHRERVLFVLDNLEKLPTIPGPKFVFAHIVSPHPPYVFGPNGQVIDKVDKEMYRYRDQIIYLNSRLIPLLKNIIKTSEIAPIIIVQGDHGAVNTVKEERMAILNAYYLPNGGNNLLYENITPVNTFRVLFNYYFGTNLELLDDTVYYSRYYKPYIYTVMPDSRPECSQ
jgi:hypothetical protein